MVLKHRDYLSFSALKQFFDCEEAAAVGFKRESKAFLEGQVFEAAVTGTLEQFLAEDEERQKLIYKRDGMVRAEFEKAIAAANRLRNDDNIMSIIENCDFQVKLEGEICGIPFVGYVDMKDRRTGDCYDYKYVRDFRNVWNEIDRYYESWIRGNHYDWQAAIYHHLGGGHQHIIAATKETVPDVGFWQFNDDYLKDEMVLVGTLAREFMGVLNGERKPFRCEKCDYCKQTKELLIPDLIG